MADKKISALTGASTPLAGTEVLPIVQSGSTVKVAVSNLTEGRSVLASNFSVDGAVDPLANGISRSGFGLFLNTITSTAGRLGVNGVEVGSWRPTGIGTPGNFIVETAAKGVNFTANTPAAGMTSQLLNWYEEGDWTPTLTRDVAPSLTYTAQVGKYVKVGRQVTLNGSLFYTVTSGGSGLIYIAGFPFASNSTSSYSASGSVGYADSIVLGADSIYVGQTSSTGILTLNGNFATGVLSSGRLYFTITYQV